MQSLLNPKGIVALLVFTIFVVLLVIVLDKLQEDLSDNPIANETLEQTKKSILLIFDWRLILGGVVGTILFVIGLITYFKNQTIV